MAVVYLYKLNMNTYIYIWHIQYIFDSCHIIHQTCDTGDTLNFCCWGKQKFIIAFGVLFFIVGPVLTALRKGKPSCAAEAVLGAVLLGSSGMSNVFDTILCLPSTYCGCLMIVWKAEGVLQVCFLAWEIWFYTAKKVTISSQQWNWHSKHKKWRWTDEPMKWPPYRSNSSSWNGDLKQELS